MPRHGGLLHTVGMKLEDVAVVLFLPIFFALTGLRTSIGLLAGPEAWLFFGLIMFVAVGGKLGGVALAARAYGVPWREAGTIGALMNTRGLMELVVLTIGLEIGILSPALFAMMVLMAITTTFMTSPVVHWLYFRQFYPHSTEPAAIVVAAESAQKP
jgi:Kef-type K+ transport system membrane component KefB